MPAERRGADVVLLDDAVTTAEVTRTMAGLGWLVWLDDPPGHLIDRMLGWTRSASLVEDPTQPFDGPLVYLKEGHMTGVRAMIVTGDDERAVLPALAAALPHYAEESLLAAAAGADDPSTLVRTVHRLAKLATPVPGWFVWRDPDARHFGVWRRLLAHPDPVVRRAAINESDLLPWRAIDDLLRERQPVETELADLLAMVMGDRRRHEDSDQPGN